MNSDLHTTSQNTKNPHDKFFSLLLYILCVTNHIQYLNTSDACTLNLENHKLQQQNLFFIVLHLTKHTALD